MKTTSNFLFIALIVVATIVSVYLLVDMFYCHWEQVDIFTGWFVNGKPLYKQDFVCDPRGWDALIEDIKGLN